MILDRKMSDYSIVVAAKEQVSSDLAGETVILDLKSGLYYGLNDVGTRIWNLVQEPKTLIELRKLLMAEYDIDPESCERELLVLLQDLATKGLIEVRNETGS